MFAKIQLPQLNNSKIDITKIKFKLHPKQDTFCFQIISITLREEREKKRYILAYHKLIIL